MCNLVGQGESSAGVRRVSAQNDLVASVAQLHELAVQSNVQLPYAADSQVARDAHQVHRRAFDTALVQQAPGFLDHPVPLACGLPSHVGMPKATGGSARLVAFPVPSL